MEPTRQDASAKRAPSGRGLARRTSPTNCGDDALVGAVPITVIDPQRKTGLVEVSDQLLRFIDPN